MLHIILIFFLVLGIDHTVLDRGWQLDKAHLKWQLQDLILEIVDKVCLGLHPTFVATNKFWLKIPNISQVYFKIFTKKFYNHQIAKYWYVCDTLRFSKFSKYLYCYSCSIIIIFLKYSLLYYLCNNCIKKILNKII